MEDSDAPSEHVLLAAATIAAVLAGMSVPASSQAPVTAFEGARIIVGDGSPAIEKGIIVVNGTTIQAVGANVQVPAGAQRVNLAGKTVMPMIRRHPYPCARDARTDDP